MQKLVNIDGGKPFDWGKTSQDYAKFRDIYPDEFYEKIVQRGLCVNGQRVLDIGSGTGVLPRNMYRYGAKWVGTDISKEQIEQAKLLAEEQDMDIEFYTCRAEDISYPDNTFDVVTACQCIWYPDHDILAPKLAKILKPGGKFLILYMGWLPFEDKIAAKSEEIIHKYNPGWSGGGDTVKPVWIPPQYEGLFDITLQEQFRVPVLFTRESWHGRVRACRGVGASLSPSDLEKWDVEHMQMLEREANENFTIQHYIAIAELSVKKQRKTNDTKDN